MLSFSYKWLLNVDCFFKKYCLWQIWTMAVMFLSKKFKRLPHFFSVNLFIAQVSTLPCALQP